MRPVITSQQSRAIDEECISKLGIASYDLMETASTNAVSCLHGILGDHHGLRIVVGCGTGNNGGDGFAMARLLSARHRVTVLHATPVDTMSAETRPTTSWPVHARAWLRGRIAPRGCRRRMTWSSTL